MLSKNVESYNDLYNKTSLGTLQDDGTILWQDNFLQKYYVDRFENARCTQCKHLPVCMGACARDYNAKVGSICRRTGEDRSVEELITNFVEQSEEVLG